MKFRFLNGDFDSGKAQIILDQSVDCLKDIVLKKQKAQERLVRKKFETKFYAAQAAAAAAVLLLLFILFLFLLPVRVQIRIAYQKPELTRPLQKVWHS